jgi:outer membrane protein assembly factor BamD
MPRTQACPEINERESDDGKTPASPYFGRGASLHSAFRIKTGKFLTILLLAGGFAALSATQCDGQILHKKKKLNKSTSTDNSAEPDKVLYERAMDDIKRGRQEVGRLSLQTLINTYPDSEYLAKAKLAIADSFYKEGGSANMTQAIQAYKDFEIFFPFLPEASYAQIQVANTHYKEMAKPDRDRSEAKMAEEEYQTFLEKYPKDPLAPQAEQRLRNVQEIIAEGDYRIGYFYYVKGDKRAAAARLIALTKRYPLYSKSDHALWMLGDVFESSEHKEIAQQYYAQIVRNYPLSPLAPDAKGKLKAFNVPVPQPDPKAQAWMVAEQNTPREHDTLIKRPLALVRSGPHNEFIAAARSGAPNLTPESDNTSATDILTPGNRSTLGGSSPTSGNAAVVEIVTPGSPGSSTNTDGNGTATSGGAASGATGTTGSGSTDGSATQPAEGTGSNPPGAAGDPKAAGTPAPAPAATDPATNAVTTTTSTDAKPVDGSTPAATGTDANGTQDSSTTSNTNQKESSSKKKKGIKKIVPW